MKTEEGGKKKPRWGVGGAQKQRERDTSLDIWDPWQGALALS